ncbi:MAG: hypothetical protein P0Y65_05860 [Candidatus Devosia phytovorans]|uniref:DUF2163 domain-containing protein n=1 Tax=Candidatus Devosia phytovorans TaxID=3121372 RepID=A0AAJ6B1H2_9HYPH|nr:hypothetical protein [Devosia sp.]WEK05781.1 MAG: hypothetical protein P0Y65_05860 [Devosia sp.]
MKQYSANTVAALAARRLMPRDFLWIEARDRVTGAPVQVGFWSDLANVSALVIDPDTGLPVSRDFHGSGSLISISDIPAIVGVSVENVTVTMSQLHDQVEEALRLYDCKQARIEIHTGLLDPDSRKLVDPAEPIFVGFIDQIEIRTPSENEEGAAVLTCASGTQELLRSNPSTRSHADQQIRAPGDDFFRDAAVCGDWDHYWGAVGQNKVEAVQQPKKRGLFGWGGVLGFL